MTKGQGGVKRATAARGAAGALVATMLLAAMVPAALAAVDTKKKPKQAKQSIDLQVTGAQTASFTDASGVFCSIPSTTATTVAGTLGGDSTAADVSDSKTKNGGRIELSRNGFASGKLQVGDTVYGGGVSAPQTVVTVSGKTFTVTNFALSNGTGTITLNGRIVCK